MPRLIWVAIVVATLAGGSLLAVNTYNSVVRYACTIKKLGEVK